MLNSQRYPLTLNQNRNGEYVHVILWFSIAVYLLNTWQNSLIDQLSFNALSFFFRWNRFCELALCTLKTDILRILEDFLHFKIRGFLAHELQWKKSSWISFWVEKAVKVNIFLINFFSVLTFYLRRTSPRKNRKLRKYFKARYWVRH